MRFLHKLYANMFGYFWLPCSLCGEMYGGHEKGKGSIMLSWNDGKSCCPNCKEEAKQYNEEWMQANPHPGVLMREE